MAFMTSSVMRTEPVKASPPWTTRWPTASISFMEPITPLSWVHQGVQHGLDGLGVGGHGNVDGVQHLLALDLGLVGELAVDADALAQALGQHARRVSGLSS